MTLTQLLNGIEYKTDLKNLSEININNITTDSRLLKDGDIFICIKGLRFDGHEYAKTYLNLKNKILVVTQKDLGLKTQIIVKNTRKVYAKMAANLMGNPADKLKIIGVTGTNGKTSTTYIIKYLLNSFGLKTGLIGTIQNEVEGLFFPAKYTTPDPLELNILLKKMVQMGCQYVVMEVSSHALDQERVYGLNFKIAIFTNLTQDHLDYHQTMENYFSAKRKLFDNCKTAIINIDDNYGKKLFEEIKFKKYSYSIESNQKADFNGNDISVFTSGTDFNLDISSNIYKMHINMLGKFFVANTLAAIIAVYSLGFKIENILKNLEKFKGVKGRAEILPIKKDFIVIRDYAHGPDGIDKILDAVNEIAQGHVMILFGCAGNRDRSKRKKMAEIAAQKSDFVILTSDNPRNEDPKSIILDALPGLEENNTPYKVIIDRYEAIKWAINNMKKDDILILAGKGHEDYQVLDFGTIYFDEYEIINEILNRNELSNKNLLIEEKGIK